jgi:hypothetical protein
MGWAPALPHVLWPQALPPCWGGLWCSHVSYGPIPCLPSGLGSGAATCPMAQTLPPCWGGLRHHHVSCGPEPCLPAGVGASAAMCPTAPDPASLLGWAPASPCVHSCYGPWTTRVKEIVAGPIMQLRLRHSPGARACGFPRHRHA